MFSVLYKSLKQSYDLFNLCILASFKDIKKIKFELFLLLLFAHTIVVVVKE